MHRQETSMSIAFTSFVWLTLTILLLNNADCDDGRAQVIYSDGRSHHWTTGSEGGQLTQGQGRIRSAAVFLSTGNAQNVTVVAGDQALLLCRVENLGSRTVAWRRQSEAHPLFIGLERFAAESRLSVERIDDGREWRLVIRDVHLHDAGTYRCHVTSKEFPTITYDVMLYVRGMHVSGTSHVGLGAAIRLNCNVTSGIAAALTDASSRGIDNASARMDADWYHVTGSSRLQLVRSNPHSGVSVTKKVDTLLEANCHLLYLVVTLDIDASCAEDAGEYTCQSSTGLAESITVYLHYAAVRSAARVVDSTQSNVQHSGSSCIGGRNRLKDYITFESISLILTFSLKHILVDRK